MTTVTLPREVVQSAMELLTDYQSDCADYEGPEGMEFIEKGIADLRAALDAPQVSYDSHITNCMIAARPAVPITTAANCAALPKEMK